ncbi:MAG: ComF family protein [Candidatus Riflebacteria bacterium]|nr:ComF family protein [Candidatus Riflebacteria bacterium]
MQSKKIKADVVIPVPLFPEREKKRGFNQAALIAEKVAFCLNSNFSPVLERTIHTAPQASLSEEDRQRNLKNAFRISPKVIPEAFLGKKLLLIDDVATTGSTISECARVLRSLKPLTIEALVLSHSFRKFPIKENNG